MKSAQRHQCKMWRVGITKTNQKEFWLLSLAYLLHKHTHTHARTALFSFVRTQISSHHHRNSNMRKLLRQYKCGHPNSRYFLHFFPYTIHYCLIASPRLPLTLNLHKTSLKKNIYICICIIYSVEYSSAIKKSETMPFAATWMDPEMIIPSEVSQRQILYDITYTWNL